MNFKKSLSNLKDDCLKRKNMLKEIVKLSFTEFMTKVDECNSWGLKEAEESKSLTKISFYVVPKSANNFLWRVKAEIEFQKVSIQSDSVIKSKILNLQQFLLLYQEIKNLLRTTDSNKRSLNYSVMIENINDKHSRSLSESSDLQSISEMFDCAICFNAKADVILPCSHSYCESCTQAWCTEEAKIHDRPNWQVLQSSNHRDWAPETLTGSSFNSLESLIMDTCNFGQFSCPICREKCASQTDLWNILEKPNDEECYLEMKRNLNCLLESMGRPKK